VRAGIGGALLGNKVNTNNPRNVLSLREAVVITGVSGDLRILQAWAAEVDCRLVPLATDDAGSLVSTLLEHSVQHGEFAHVLHEALADGVITEREMRDIEAAGGNLQGVMLKLLRQMKHMQRVSP
jgi:hypothetical protein